MLTSFFTLADCGMARLVMLSCAQTWPSLKIGQAG